MIKLNSHVIKACPICGRPVELQSWYIGKVITCSHCCGHFVIHQSEDRILTATTCGRGDVLNRAERLLRREARSQAPRTTTPSRCRLEASSKCGRGKKTRIGHKQAVDRNQAEPAAKIKRKPAAKQPIALLVEHRDEVFARIATDLAEAGMRVLRARTVVEALTLSVSREPMVVVANVDLPDQSGWLLAGKLSFIDPTIRIWLYQPKRSDYDVGLAEFLQVQELFEYGGDLLGLSESIMQLIAERRERNQTASSPPQADNVLIV